LLLERRFNEYSGAQLESHLSKEIQQQSRVRLFHRQE
jgi:hypothetical protein